MNVVDSCGWLEYFTDGQNTGWVEQHDHIAAINSSAVTSA